jgi:hypothetical protein
MKMAIKLVTILYEVGDQVATKQQAWDWHQEYWIPEDTVLTVDGVKQTMNEDWQGGQLLHLAGWAGWYESSDFELYEEEQDGV